MNYLLLELSGAETTVDNDLSLTTESYISLFVWKLLSAQDEVRVKIVKSSDASNTSVPVRLDGIAYETIDNDENAKLPMLELGRCHKVVGLCGVLRGMCLLMRPTEPLATQLLGFKENCLMAPSEVSPWTNFCEREMVSCVEALFSSSGEIQFPIEMMKLELDMANPVRLHNVYKVARDTKNDQSIKSGSELDLEHKYCHGNEMNLSDVILYALYKLIFTSAIDVDDVKHIIPLTIRWFNHMETLSETYANLIAQERLNRKHLTFHEELPRVKEDGKYFSLFKRELTGYKHKNRRMFTQQKEVDVVLDKLKSLNIDIGSEPGDPNQDSIDDDYVCELLKVGELPAQRLDKKKSQLKSLTCEVLKIAQPGDVIVDFCSGTGHLGFLIAKLLPECRVIILENKEESINRAKAKATKLKLNNVTFYQCNLVSDDWTSLFLLFDCATLVFRRNISTRTSPSDCRCTLAASPPTWCSASAGVIGPASSALRAATARSKISARYRRASFIDKSYHPRTSSTFLTARIKHTMRKT